MMAEEKKADHNIKCTYDDCSRHFPTIEAMKKHKAKDEVHDYYCKRCDYDGTDDTWLFYHQITSLKHMCCPVCGRDFKSEGGRDRHVDIEHRSKQKMSCAGCETSFDSASSLMAHIEHNQCPVISRMHFYRQRAERQVSKDVWQMRGSITAGTTISSEIETRHTVIPESTLLDDDQAWIPTDWAGNRIDDGQAEVNGSDSSTIADQMSNLSIDKFPPLNPRNRSQKQARNGKENSGGRDLLDIDPVMTNTRGCGQQEDKKKEHSWLQSNELPSGGVSILSDDNQSAVTAQTSATYRTASGVGQDSLLIPQNQGNNNEDTHVTTATQRFLPSYLQMSEHWDPLSEQYACPSRNCGQRFPTIDAFKAHLLSDAHVNSSVKCPGCMKRFNTTTALVAHCESASRKCKVRYAIDYDMVIRQITAGMISADGYQEDGSIRYTAEKIEDW